MRHLLCLAALLALTGVAQAHHFAGFRAGFYGGGHAFAAQSFYGYGYSALVVPSVPLVAAYAAPVVQPVVAPVVQPAPVVQAVAAPPVVAYAAPAYAYGAVAAYGYAAPVVRHRAFLGFGHGRRAAVVAVRAPVVVRRAAVVVRTRAIRVRH